MRHAACRRLLRLLIAGAVLIGLDAPAQDGLTIGITLHPYYSFAANVVGDAATVVPLIGAGNNPHGYNPQADDIKRVMEFDALIVNGIGHDEWAFEIIGAAGVADTLPLIYANDDVALIPVASDPGTAKVVNPHTFISVATAIQQVYTIARELGELDPGSAETYRRNAFEYTARLRRMKAEYTQRLSGLDLSRFRCATMHGGYDYLLQEFGLSVTAVIEPRHGVQPTARQLADTIDRIQSADVNVLFAEKYFADQLAGTIREATGVQIFAMSHISDGAYTPDKFELDMRENLETLVAAVQAAIAAR